MCSLAKSLWIVWRDGNCLTCAAAAAGLTHSRYTYCDCTCGLQGGLGQQPGYGMGMANNVERSCQ
jgi:hypothetical protein